MKQIFSPEIKEYDFFGSARPAGGAYKGRSGARLAVIPTNDWKNVKDYHAENMIYRAVENRISIVRAASGGVSQIIDYRGVAVARRDPFEEGEGRAALLTASVPVAREGVTFFAARGNVFAWLCLAASLLLFAAALFRRKSGWNRGDRRLRRAARPLARPPGFRWSGARTPVKFEAPVVYSITERLVMTISRVSSAVLCGLFAAGCTSGMAVLPQEDAFDAADAPDDDLAAGDLTPDDGVEEGDPGVDVFEDEASDGAVDAVGEDAGPDLPDLEECDPSVWYTYGASGLPASISDDDPGGITSWIDVMDCAAEVWDLQVEVEIQHPRIGDLLIKLLSPDGREVILHNRTGGVVANIVTTYPTATDPYQTLCGVTRQTSAGRWGLFVSDNAASASGELASWGLGLTGTVDACPTTRWYSYDSFPLDIPDNDPAGISSTIDVAESGAVTSIRVGVDIRHPTIGNLRVSIVSPDGTQRLLHDRTGGMSANIHTFYPTPTAPDEDITVYLGMERSGTWTLDVSDHAAGDVGALEGWVLEIN